MACAQQPAATEQQAPEPSPKREFRGVWIATVNNIDWPSKPGLSSEQQQQEFVRLLDFHRSCGMNALFVQVRSAADALYYSEREPWSAVLTGTQGKAPEPYYDPLAFMIEETHRRGMEFHAWVNPFRSMTNAASANIAPDHMAKRRPEWMLAYGNTRMFDPGVPEVRRYLAEVIEDIVRRYDVDGVHFDDYFYPYPEVGAVLDDEASFRRYGGGMRKDDWRRENINAFVRMVHQRIRMAKPKIKFGISPYAVWRNQRETAEGSPTEAGMNCYDHLYADVRLWLQKGWIDYVAPQAYQSSKHRKIPYQPLVAWWAQNTFGRHLYVGHAAYRLLQSPEAGWENPQEVPDQVRYNRTLPGVQGNVMYSSRSLLRNFGSLSDNLRERLYYHPALLPPMPWLDNTPPMPPQRPIVSRSAKGIVLSWQAPAQARDGDRPAAYVIYSAPQGEQPDTERSAHILAVVPAGSEFYVDVEAEAADQYHYRISSLDRFHNESEVVTPVIEGEMGSEKGLLGKIMDY